MTRAIALLVAVVVCAACSTDVPTEQVGGRQMIVAAVLAATQ